MRRMASWFHRRFRCPLRQGEFCGNGACDNAAAMQAFIDRYGYLEIPLRSDRTTLAADYALLDILEGEEP